MELEATVLWVSRLEPEEPEITILVERAIAGDIPAFERLILRYERRVLTLAWRLLGSAEDAEDASQEVLVRLHRYLHRFEDGREFAPWLYRMTVNVCRDLLRKRPAKISLDAVPDVAVNDRPDQRLGEQEMRRMLLAGLERLTAGERAAVVLRDIEGLSTGEVAEALQTSQVTVRSHICRARLKLKSFVDACLRRQS